MHKSIIRSLVVMAIMVFHVFTVVAQGIPPGQEPGAQAKRFQLESQQRARELQRQKPKTQVVEVEKEKAEETPAADETRFVLKGIKLTGARTFSESEIQPLYEKYLDKDVTHKDITAIADVIRTKYKQKGYLTTAVYVPEQNVVDGIVEIKISEGDFGKIKVDGNKYFGSELLKKYIHSKKNEILNLFILQKDILRINQNPDVQVKATVTAGEEPGTSDIRFDVTDKFPFHAGAGFDNQGTRSSGKDRTSLWIRDTNITGHNDSVFANVQFSRSTSGEFISYLLPADTYGTKVGVDITYFEMKLGDEFKFFDITGKTLIFTPHVSRELFLSENAQATADLGIDIKSIIQKTGKQYTSNDQIRQPYVGLNLTGLDSLAGGGQTIFAPKMTFGTSRFLGASDRGHPTTQRPGTGGDGDTY